MSQQMWRLSCVFLLLLLAPFGAAAHDASAYGGMFRSRSMGSAWTNADVGLFLSAALAVAVDPRDPNHLLMGSDSGLLASVNGGRGWTQQAPVLISGAVFAVAFSRDGAAVVCSGPGGIYRSVDGTWRQSDVPAGAVPARGIVFSDSPGRAYLLGRDRLFRSDDGGLHFTRLAGDADDAIGLETLAVLRHPVETLFGIAQGRVMASSDGGQRWQQRRVNGTSDPVETVSPDPAVSARVWAAAGDRVYVSNDAGRTWQAIGALLPELHTVVRGIAADPAGRTLVLTTHRGTYRSTDAGEHWTLEEGNLPVHLEAGPLARDPSDPGILYVVYSLIPYPEVWRNALDGSNLLARADPMSLIGGAAFLVLLTTTGSVLVIWLVRRRGDMPGAAG